MNDPTTQSIQLEIDTAKEAIKIRHMLNELKDDPKFNAIVNEGYLNSEPARLAMLLGDPAYQTPEQLEATKRSLSAIGEFNQYLHRIYVFGGMADKALLDAETAQEEHLNPTEEV